MCLPSQKELPVGLSSQRDVVDGAGAVDAVEGTIGEQTAIAHVVLRADATIKYGRWNELVSEVYN